MGNLQVVFALPTYPGLKGLKDGHNIDFHHIVTGF